MALMYLLDTSVFTRLGSPVVRTRIEQLGGQRLYRTTMSDLEIGFSARSEPEWMRLATALGAFDLLETSQSNFIRACEVQRLLCAEGLRGRKIPDLLIAAVAESNSLTLLHYDSDFDHISGVTGQRTEWVAARGTID